MRRIVTSWMFAVLVFLLGLNEVRADRLVVVAGGGTEADNTPAVKAKLQGPFGVDFSQAGDFYLVEMIGQRVCRVDGTGKLMVIAGTGAKGNTGDDGPATKAEFNGPHSLVTTPNGDLYIADTWNNRVRKIDGKTGIISAFAGTAEKGFAGDGGPAAKAKFGGVYCAAFGPRHEKLYIADLDNRRIRAIDLKSGVVTTVAGNGEKGVPEDGAEATKAPLVDPRAVAVDAKERIYILERSGHALRVVDTTGKIRTVVGTGKPGGSGDGSDARQATLNGPKHLCIDPDGNVLIADTENHLIRKYRPATGKIVRVAGTGKKGKGGIGGPPEKAELSQPHGIHVSPSGEIYIADSSNDRVLKIERKE